MPRATRSKAPPPPVEVEEEEMSEQPEEDIEEEVEEMEVDEQEDEEEQNGDGDQEIGDADQGEGVGGEGESEEQEEEEEEEQPMLQNDEPISWKAGKAIPVATLLKRLRALSEELLAYDQGDVSRESLVPKAKELVNPQLLHHKDPGVVAYTLHCIVEMFKLLAPDAPYKQSQLADIFNKIVALVIPAVGDPSHTYNAQNLAIVQSLAKVKSIALITDLPGENLVVSLFTNCFDVMADNVPGREKELLSKNVEFSFTSILTVVIDEMDSLPSQVVDIILAQFLRADPRATSKKGKDEEPPIIKEVSPAYSMARSVCNACDEALRRHIGHYFNNVLIDATETKEASKTSKSRSKKRARQDSEDEDDAGVLEAPSESDLAEAEKAHRLLRELWRACPNLLQNVIPQIEAEVGAENTPLRTMGVAAVGDMIAGIGAAGPPVPASLDPAAWPSQSLDTYAPPPQTNVLLVAAASQALSTVYPTAYQAFVDRNRDKSAQVRAVWATSAGRILATSAGGKGLDSDQQSILLRLFADLIVDTDERVRLASVKVIAQFDFPSILQKLCAQGGVDKEGSVLYNLCSRVRDPKHAVSAAAIDLAGRIWGVAAGAIVEGNERIRELFGSIPTKIFDAMYANHKPLYALIQKVMYDSLLPIGFPYLKTKSHRAAEAQRVSDSQNGQDAAPDLDRIRVERILVLVRDLNDRSRPAFFALQQQQISRAKYLKKILELSETLGKKTKSKDEQAEQHREKLIEAVATSWPEKTIVEHHLTTFFESNDQRGYKLADFATSPKSTYKQAKNGIAELVKRLKSGTSNLAGCAETLQTVFRSSAPLVYNRSHVPAIVAISRGNEDGLDEAAHEVLKQISAKAPEVFEIHVKELCETLKQQAPTTFANGEISVVDSLKACAGFARQFPQKMPSDRDFYQAMSKYAKFGFPAVVSKQAITVIVASADKKEMYIKDVLKHSLKEVDVSAEISLTKLAALSQLRLLAYQQTEEQADAIQEILTDALHNRTAAEETDPKWAQDISQDLSVQLWALKVFVNGLRAQATAADVSRSADELEDTAIRVFKLLNTIIAKEGELTGVPTPAHHKSRLRLAAGKFILKLCCNKPLDQYFAPRDFNRLTQLVQDPQEQVRIGFNTTLKKYLTQGKLSLRFFSLMFVHAFEPLKSLKTSTETFLKARATTFAKTPETEAAMVQVFAYFLSLLSHHQDFSPAAEDIPDFIDYILFYLRTVATEQNLSAIYAIALRAKTCEDLVDPTKSKLLWTMADLADAIIRSYEQAKGWTLQAAPGKPKMPGRLFSVISDKHRQEEVSRKRFLPAELDEAMDELVKDRLKKKSKKRKAGNDDDRGSTKKARPSHATEKSMPARKKAAKSFKAPKSANTPKRSTRDAAPSSERRKSARASNAKSYIEDEDSDEEEFERWQAEASSDDDDEANKENVSSTSTPPTSDPVVRTAEPATTGATRGKQKASSAKNTKSGPVPQKRAAPARGSRSTRALKNEKTEKDIVDISSGNEEDGESDEELSDAPDEVEV